VSFCRYIAVQDNGGKLDMGVVEDTRYLWLVESKHCLYLIDGVMWKQGVEPRLMVDTTWKQDMAPRLVDTTGKQDTVPRLEDTTWKQVGNLLHKRSLCL
jgi:hypothetical protein